MTFGEKLAGISFNPSNDSDVDEVKNAAAKFMDSIHEAQEKMTAHVPIQSIPERLMEEAKIRALEAQMLAVKAITWKY